jgi:hypothetical protein
MTSQFASVQISLGDIKLQLLDGIEDEPVTGVRRAVHDAYRTTANTLSAAVETLK